MAIGRKGAHPMGRPTNERLRRREIGGARPGMAGTAAIAPLILAVLLGATSAAQPPAPGSGPGEEVDLSKVYPAVVAGPTLHPAPGWPLWLVDFGTRTRTDETSGIAFVGRDATGAQHFLLADDTGVFHHCTVRDPAGLGVPVLQLSPVAFTASLLDSLDEYEKWDFEALALELPRPRPPPADTIRAWVSIEGRGKRFREHAAVHAMDFIGTPVKKSGDAEAADASRCWQVEARGAAIPGGRFWEGHVSPNRGLEGLAIGDRIAFLGLESLSPRSELSAAGTILFVYDRSSNRVARIGTRPLEIRSICGLDAWGDSLSVLVDRNRQSLFLLWWDLKIPGRIRAAYRFALDLPAPDGFRYAVPSVEGLALDDRGDFWCVTDPWRGHYHPIGAAPETLRVYLEAEMPMLYRFCGRPVWQTAGLEHLWPDASARSAPAGR